MEQQRRFRALAGRGIGALWIGNDLLDMFVIQEARSRGSQKVTGMNDEQTFFQRGIWENEWDCLLSGQRNPRTIRRRKRILCRAAGWVSGVCIIHCLLNDDRSDAESAMK